MSQKALPPLWVWRQLNTVSTVVGFSLLGQACFSEWNLVAFFLAVPLFLPSSAPFYSPSLCFCFLSQDQRPVLRDFRSSDQEKLFSNLIAQFVGGWKAAELRQEVLPHWSPGFTGIKTAQSSRQERDFRGLLRPSVHFERQVFNTRETGSSKSF